MPYAICYVVSESDRVVDITTETSYTVSAARADASYCVQAVNEFGGLSVKAEVKEESGIADIYADNYEVESYYDIHGRRICRPVKGVNIVVLRNAAGDTRVEKTVYRQL